jgi:Tfp pilus assembly protein PilN
MRFAINLATRKPGPTVLSAVVIAVIAGIALIYSIYNIYDFAINRRETAVLKESIARMQEKLKTEGKDARRLAAIGDIMARKGFSWTTLLTALEETLPPNVSLTGIKAETKGGAVVIDGMAFSANDVLQFVSALSARGDFTDVFLLRHSQENREAVLFTVSGSYREEGSL